MRAFGLHQFRNCYSRAEIAQHLWSSEVFVDTEHGINTAIRKLRHLLRDDSEDPKFIQNATGMGYRFIAPTISIEEPVTDPFAAPTLEPASLDPGPASEAPTLPSTQALPKKPLAVQVAVVARFVALPLRSSGWPSTRSEVRRRMASLRKASRPPEPQRHTGSQPWPTVAQMGRVQQLFSVLQWLRPPA